MKLARCPEQMKERVRNLDMQNSTDSWNKIRDLRHTLIQYLLQQNRFGTGEDETIEREEDVRRHVGGMPLLTDLSLAMRTDPLALIRGVKEFVTVIYGPAVTFAFPDVKVEAYRRSVLHLNLISAVDGSTLNWCEQHALRELMSEDLLLSPGYAHLPDGLKFVYAMVALLSEGKYDVIISAPNRMIEVENLRPLKAELPAVWSDISNAMRGFKDHALHMLVLDEVLGLGLSNFSRQLKLKPGIDDDHRVITAMSNDLWFRAMEVASEDTRRKNSLETRAQLEAMVLRSKPEANQWLYLNHRVAALGADAFQQGPVMITKIHAYLLKEVNLAENAGEKTAEFVNRVCQITLETFWTQEVKGQEGFERTDSMLEGLGAGWTASFLAKVYPKVSHYLIKEFLQAVVKVSIVELRALFVTFGAENFVKGPALLLTDGIQNLRLD